MPTNELAKWELAGLASDTMKVEYLEIGDRVPPILIDGADEDLTLREYTFQNAPHRIIAAYSLKTNTWIVGRRAPQVF